MTFHRINTGGFLRVTTNINKVAAVFFYRDDNRLLIFTIQRCAIGFRQIHINALHHHRCGDHKHHQQHQHNVDIRHHVNIGHQLTRCPYLHRDHYCPPEAWRCSSEENSSANISHSPTSSSATEAKRL